MPRNLKPAVFMHIQKTAGTTIVDLARSAYGNDSVMSHGDYVKGINYCPLTGKVAVDEKVLQDFHRVPFLSGHFGYGFAKRYMNDRYSFTFLRNPIERILSFYYFCRGYHPTQLAKRRMRDLYPFEVLRDPVERMLAFYYSLRGIDPDKVDIYKLSQRTTLDEFLQMGLMDSEVRNFIWNNQVWQLACGFGDLDIQPLSFFKESELLEMAANHIDKFSYVGFAETFELDRDNILKDLGMMCPQERIISNATPGRPTFHDLPQSTRDLLFALTELDRALYQKVWSGRAALSQERS